MTSDQGRGGAVVISLDTELAWGKHDLKDYRHLGEVHRSRENVRKILDLSDKYSIPITWAVVGHLFLRECEAGHNVEGYPEGWYEEDPASDYLQAPLWYAPDMVEEIEQRDAGHEVALHGFSHLVFRGASRVAAEEELHAAKRAAEAAGHQPRSFVYPREQVGHTDLLDQHGIHVFRDGPTPYLGCGFMRGKAGKALRELSFWRPAPLSRLDKVDGVTRTTLSMNLAGWGGQTGLVRLAYQKLKLRKIRKSLDELGRQDGVLHLGAHPHNFSTPGDFFFLAEVFHSIAEKAAGGNIKTLSMRDLADDY